MKYIFFRYEYIALLDIDEIIVPLQHENWAEMMEEAPKMAKRFKDKQYESLPVASWNFRNVYFMDDMIRQQQENHYHVEEIPQHLHMMQHVYR